MGNLRRFLRRFTFGHFRNHRADKHLRRLAVVLPGELLARDFSASKLFRANELEAVFFCIASFGGRHLSRLFRLLYR